MVNVKELRIGNLVYNTKNETKRVFSIQANFVSIEDANGNPQDYHLLNPIPLTEEIIKKCGFKEENIDGKMIFHYNGIFLEQNCNGFQFQKEGLSGRFILLNIINLHHLQNLFFDLTNQELSI